MASTDLRFRMAGAIALAAAIAALGGCTSRNLEPIATTTEANMKTVTIPITGMSCAACVARIKKVLSSIDGVSEIEVNLIERNARIRFDPSKLAPDRLVAAIKGLGYQASPPTEAR